MRKCVNMKMRGGCQAELINTFSHFQISTFALSIAR